MFSLLSDAKNKVQMSNLGEISPLDGALSIGAFSAFLVEFTEGADIQIPLPDQNVALSEELFTLGNTSVSIALALGFVLFGIQFAQSATKIGSNSNMDLKGYLDSLPTGLTILVVFTLGIHVLSLLQGQIGIASDLVQTTQSEYWRQVTTAGAMTLAYMGVSRYN